MSDLNQKNRSLKSIKQTSPMYWNIMGLAFLIFMTAISALSLTVYWIIDYQNELMTIVKQPELSPEILYTQSKFIELFWVQVGIFGILSILLFIRVCHRIAGTYIALQRTFDSVAEGNTSTKLKFRDYDKLENLSDSFNHMMDTLEKKTSDPKPVIPPDSNKTQKGFTLVEIMIVVMIIALLATLAIPSYTKPRDVARRDICRQNLRLMENAKQLWALDYNKISGDVPDISEISPYVKKGEDSLTCPIDPAKNFASSYELNGVDTPPTCKIEPATHNLE